MISVFGKIMRKTAIVCMLDKFKYKENLFRYSNIASRMKIFITQWQIAFSEAGIIEPQVQIALKGLQPVPYQE